MTALGDLWAKLRRGWTVLVAVRFSLVVVLGAGVAFVSNEQFQDLLAGFEIRRGAAPAEALGHLLRMAGFVLAVTWWALQGWGWARRILAVEYPEDEDGRRAPPGLEGVLVDYLPRLIAMGAFALAEAAAWTSESPLPLRVAIALTAAAVFAYLVARRRLRRGLLRGIAHRPEAQILGATLTVVVLSAAWAIASPVSMGRVLGAGTVVVLGLGCIVPVGSYAVEKTYELGIPVVTLALAAAALFSLWNDNHGIRTVGEGRDRRPSLRLEAAYAAWRTQIDRLPAPRPLVLVATAGGGLRAAYWTGVVLGALEDRVPGFHRHVFAISGVSGGSVGAVFYDAALVASPGCTSRSRQRPGPCLEEPLLGAIGRDYLGPVATALVYGDLLQRFLPAAVLPDRAAALEGGFEDGFRRQFPEAPCGLDRPFRALWSDPACRRGLPWLPLLLLNGTYEETGRRVVTAPVAVRPDVFLDTDDFYLRHGRRAIPASTAAHNSARFTFVSPAGTFEDEEGRRGHLLDGGYFENYAAETLRQVVRWLERHPERRAATRPLVAIVISNDPRTGSAAFASAAPEPATPARFLNEVQAPLRGLLATREARGLLAVQALEQTVREECALRGAGATCPTPRFVHFRLETRATGDPPLGWVLSTVARENMRRQVDEGSNCRALSEVLEAFGTSLPACRG